MKIRKEEWEYKKLGEVCEIRNGKNQNKVIDPNGKYPIYGSGGIMGYANSYLCEEGTTIIGRKGTINKPIFVDTKFWNVDTAFGLCPMQKLHNRYLFYFCQYFDFLSLDKRAVLPSLTKGDLLKIRIPIPPFSEQQQIVEELDLLNSLIEKKKEQLKELDYLAQATFYDMFGDPVENEKGWEVKKLGNICDVRDGTHDSPKYIEKGYPLITSKNIINGEISFDTVNYISEEDFKNINKRSKVNIGDIIMPMIGTIGNPIVVKITRDFCIKNVALIKFSKDSIANNLFIKSIISSKQFDTYMKSLNKGGTQKFLALGVIRELIIPTPPLPLQHLFAEKIEAIEQQKTLIKQSITDIQQILDYTMDKYFG